MIHTEFSKLSHHAPRARESGTGRAEPLTVVGEPTINLFGTTFAVVEFDWDFMAVRRSNGGKLHSTGRESHVYIHVDDHGWRLLHVHYSEPTVAGGGGERRVALNQN
ncbi:hypothetical protein [Burkholderia lata]|uniref:SnoaL-like domain-containing protein n=1 Tax=Burkholderia lata (strain ATCC 17760 / DSM 23089 / LMG 22485 / NCIMB 9086 / R18194 / 383) TaxID=482957 RepID=Q39G43_BURL3|nr:hypothetical protein [Burkholderia lata]ABB08573.1 hypothetical protein Bcep18194_A4979 [Burkholderia lata]